MSSLALRAAKRQSNNSDSLIRRRHPPLQWQTSLLLLRRLYLMNSLANSPSGILKMTVTFALHPSSTRLSSLNKNRSVRQMLLSTSLLGFEDGERESMRKSRLLDHPDLQAADTARQERGRRFGVLDRVRDKLTRQELKEYGRLKGSFRATASWCCAEAPLFSSLRACRIRSQSPLEI